MSTVAKKLTVEQFRATYAERKPYYALLNGEAVQKSSQKELHSALQAVLCFLLRELGFKPRPELTLAIGATWEPVPDVCGLLGHEEDEPYPTRPVPVAIEILSPGDPFTRVDSKMSTVRRVGYPGRSGFRSAGRLGTGTPRLTIWQASRKAICSRASRLS